MAAELRPFQLRAFDDYRKIFKTGTAHLGIAPTAFGKTIFAAHLAGAMIPKTNHRFIFLAHRENLVASNADKARRFYPELKVGIERAEFEADPDCDFISASVATLRGKRLDRVAKAWKADGRPLFLIVDEAHHELAPSYAAVRDALQPDRRLGLTATPFRTDDEDGTSLREIYPELAFRIDRGEMMDDGWLARAHHYRIDSGCSLFGVKSRAGDYVEKELAEALDLKERNEKIIGVLQEICEMLPAEIGQDVLRGVVFCLSVDHAEKIAEAIRRIMGWQAAAITASTPPEERREWDRKLAESPKHTVLTTFGVLTEGWDVEQVNVGLFARPTKSRVLSDQMIGRVLRWLPTKTKALLIDVADEAAESRVSVSASFNLPTEWNASGVCLREDEKWFLGKLKSSSYSVRADLWKAKSRAEVEVLLVDVNHGPKLFEGTGWMWLDMGPELRLVVGKKGTTVVYQTDFGDFQIEWRRGTRKTVLGQRGKLLDAIRYAQSCVELEHPEDAEFLRVRAFDDGRPASSGQLEYLRRMNLPAPIGMSLRDARIAISIAVTDVLRLAESGLCTFGKYKGSPISEIPEHYLRWALENPLSKRDSVDVDGFRDALAAKAGRSLRTPVAEVARPP